MMFREETNVILFSLSLLHVSNYITAHRLGGQRLWVHDCLRPLGQCRELNKVLAALGS